MRKFARIAKWCCYIVAPIATIVAVVLWWYVAVLPGKVRGNLIDTLHDIGLGDATVDAVSVTTGRAVITGVRLGPDDRHRIASIEAIYNMGDALDGHVKVLRISGATYDIKRDDAGFDWGPLSQLNLPQTQAGTAPFERLELVNCAVRCDMGDSTLVLPFDATVTPQGDDAFNLAVTPVIAGAACSLDGRLTMAGTGANRVYGVSLTPRNMPAGWAVRPQDFNATYDAASGRWLVNATTQTPQGLCTLMASNASDSQIPDDFPKGDWTAFLAGPDGTADWMLAVTANGSAFTFNAHAVSDAPMSYSAGGWSVAANQVQWSGTISHRERWQIEGVLSSPAVTVRQGEQFAATASIDLPVTYGVDQTQAAAASESNLSTGPIMLSGHELAPLAARVRFDDGMLTLSSKWSPLVGVDAAMEGELSVRSGMPRGTVRLTTNPIALDSDAVARLVRTTLKLNASGRLKVEGTVDVDGKRVTPNLTLAMAGVSASSKTYDTEFSGLNGTLTLNSLLPLASGGNQRFTVDMLRTGTFIIDDADVALRIESPDSIFVEHAKGTWREGGDFRMRAFRFDPQRPVIATDLFFEELDLAGILSLIPAGGATGRGTLFGRVPITINPLGKPVVRLDTGFLYSKPGDDGGSLQFRREDLLDTALQNVSNATQRQQIVQALRDFTYRNLRFDLIRQDDGTITCRVHVEGVGRDGKTPLNLTINLNNFGDLVEYAVLIKRGSDRAMDAALDRMLPGL